MAFELFGYSFRKNEENPKTQQSFAPEVKDDGATVIMATGGSYGTYVDLEGSVKTEAELVTKYREMALQSEVDEAITNIMDEAITIDETQQSVDILLDDLSLQPKTKEIILAEFRNILRLLDYDRHCYNIFRRWYVDGRLIYHAIIDENNPLDGVKEFRYIDPRKIKKIREVKKQRMPVNKNGQSVDITQTVSEYYLYNEKGFAGKKESGSVGQSYVGAAGGYGTTATGLKIAKDSILHVTSGITDSKGIMTLGYLHQAIKPLNQLRILEDATLIYRISRAPERRIFYIDVGNLPKIKAEQHLADMMAKHRNKLVYDASSGEVRDSRKFMCLDMKTKVPLLDGRTLTLEEITTEHQAGKKNWVYSCDPVTGKFAPGPVSWAGVTIKDSQVVKVTFDNGESVICTPDHKFPVWGKGFIEAQHLVGESVIPGYRRNQDINGNGNEYEQIYQNDTKTWEYTHRLVSTWKDGAGLREEFTFLENKEKKNTIHHKDFNRFNNNPDNLVRMGWKDHMKYHTQYCNSDELRKKNGDLHTLIYTQEIINLVEQAAKDQLINLDAVKFINAHIDSDAWMKANNDKVLPKRASIPWKFLYRDLLQVCKQLGYKGWLDYSKQFSTQETITRYKKITPEFYRKRSQNKVWRENLSIAAKNRKSPTIKSWKITTPDGDQEIIDNLNEYCRQNGLHRTNIKGDFGSKGYFAEVLRNHKAVSVEWLPETMDVGCLTVDLEETYHSHHSYLLDVGVFTKNTMLEDFWLPRREGGRGTEISTLPSGQNLGELQDVLYFQKRLYKALQVPIGRLDPEQAFTIGRSTQISRDEVKFSKFIDRLRTKFSTLFTDALEKQLVLKGYFTVDEWKQIAQYIRYRFAKDNVWSDLKDIEILTSRIEAANGLAPFIGKYFAHTTVRKDIFRQSEEEIQKNDVLIIQEMQNPILYPPQPVDETGGMNNGQNG